MTTRGDPTATISKDMTQENKDVDGTYTVPKLKKQRAHLKTLLSRLTTVVATRELIAPLEVLRAHFTRELIAPLEVLRAHFTRELIAPLEVLRAHFTFNNSNCKGRS